MVKITLYKASWCGYCTKYKEEWENLKNMLSKKENVEIHEYDWDKDKHLFDKQKVSSVPTLIMNNVKIDDVWQTNNIIKMIDKELEKENKTQNGGKQELIADIYKQKYLKYKIKYLELKKYNK
jgi:glutaredoxin